MAKDDFKNLGFKDDSTKASVSNEKGVKGELLW